MNERPLQQPMFFATAAVAVTLITFVVLIACGVSGALVVERQLGVPAAPAAGQTPRPAVLHIQTLDQTLFGMRAGGLEAKADAARRLAGYAWVDRNAGVVHIPIERAMDIVARGTP